MLHNEPPKGSNMDSNDQKSNLHHRIFNVFSFSNAHKSILLSYQTNILWIFYMLVQQSKEHIV